MQSDCKFVQNEYLCKMIQRQLERKLKQLYKYFPVVSLNGPRQSGKSTLLKNAFPKLPYITLENPDDLAIALSDPRRFLDGYPKGVIIDEVQNAPQLFSYIQGIVDINKKIKFVLSGSQNFLMNQHISQTLAGRVGLITLLPLSLPEMKAAGLLKDSFSQVAYTGFYPRLYDKKIPPSLFYPSYLQTYVQRDVLQLIKVTDASLFTKFIRLLAGRVGQLVNLSSLSNDTGVTVNTIKAWISVLEASYIILSLKPHHENFAKRLVQQPKIYFYDTGLLCYLLGIQNPKQVDTHFARGGIFENMVIIDLLKNKLNNAQQGSLFFWRDKHGKEVDCIIESAGSLYPIEIKSSLTKSLHFFSELNYYKELAKNKSKKSFVVYGGKEIVETKNGSMLPWNEMEALYKI